MSPTDIPAIDAERSAAVAEFGASLTELEPIGAAVHGLDLASHTPPPAKVVQALTLMSTVGWSERRALWWRKE